MWCEDERASKNGGRVNPQTAIREIGRCGVGVLEIGQSAVMRQFVAQLRAAAISTEPLLLRGETGVGKSLSAQFVHRIENARRGSFLAVRGPEVDERFCSALGAGNFGSLATLAIEEVADLASPGQRRLLRLLSSKDAPRIIATSARDGEMAILRGTLLRSLWDRLRAIEVHVPSLRERREDIPLLADAFRSEFNGRYGRAVESVDEDALELLVDHSWAGNVRELRNEIARAVLVASTPKIRVGDLSPDLQRGRQGSRGLSSLRQRSREIERGVVSRVLERHGWNVSAAARELGISRVGLSKKLRVLEIWRPGSGRLESAPILRPRR